jgi:nitroreductase
LECEWLIKCFGKRAFSVDAACKWAIEKFCVAKYQLPVSEQLVNAELTSAEHESTFKRVVLDRRSVRKWDASNVEVCDVEEAVELAKFAPSSCNRQPWQVLLLRTEEHKKFLGDYFPNTFWMTAPLLAVILMDPRVYVENEKHLLYLDAGCFIQNFILALHNRGYGACWIGFKGWNNQGDRFIEKKKQDDFFRKFNVQSLPVSMIALGRPGARVNAPVRKGNDSIIISRFL